jgi:hypothetical protein
MSNYAAEYFHALESLLGRPEDRRGRAPEPIDDGLPPIYALFFDDWPMPGVLSAFTLGAGLAPHLKELDAHVELVLSLRTADERWGLALAFLAERCRSHIVIGIGSTMDMGGPLSTESAMSSFVVTRPHQWTEPPRLQADSRRVMILEAHPLYPSELPIARARACNCIERHVAGHRYDVARPELGAHHHGG